MSPDTEGTLPVLIFKRFFFIYFLKVFGRKDHCSSCCMHLQANSHWELQMILPREGVMILPLSKQQEASFNISHLGESRQISFWNYSVSVFCLGPMCLPWSLPLGPSQSLPGPFSILFVPGSWTVNGLGSVVNNTESWWVTPIRQWRSVQTITQAVWAASELSNWKLIVRHTEDPFILVSGFFH